MVCFPFSNWRCPKFRPPPHTQKQSIKTEIQHSSTKRHMRHRQHTAAHSGTHTQQHMRHWQHKRHTHTHTHTGHRGMTAHGHTHTHTRHGGMTAHGTHGSMFHFACVSLVSLVSPCLCLTRFTFHAALILDLDPFLLAPCKTLGGTETVSRP